MMDKLDIGLLNNNQKQDLVDEISDALRDLQNTELSQFDRDQALDYIQYYLGCRNKFQAMQLMKLIKDSMQ